MAAYILTDSQKVTISIAAVDKKGAPADVQGIAFASSDTTVATVEQDAGDMTKAVVVAGMPGSAQISVTADADLGDGVSLLTGVFDLSVVGGQAVGLSVSAGSPEEQA